MSTPLRLLILEDNPSDAELLVVALRRAGFEPDWKRVETEADFAASLDPALDFILADYHLPTFDGMRALHLLQERDLDIPFILISGTVGEELAVEAIKQGGADYLLKDRLTRLGPAVANALENKRLRTERQRADQALVTSERRFRALVENAPDAITLLGVDGTVLYDSPAAPRLLGYETDELLGSSVFALVHPDDMAQVTSLFGQALRQEHTPVTGIFRFRHKDDSWRWIEAAASNMLAEPSVQAVVVNYRDITERRATEQALRESEGRFHGLFDNATIGMYRTTPDGRILASNPAAVRMLGYESFEVLAQRNLEEQGWEAVGGRSEFRERLERDGAFIGVETTWTKKDGSRIIVSESATAVRDEKGTILYYDGTFEDITARKRAEAEALALQDIMEGTASTGGLQEFLELIRRSLAKVIYAENCFVVFHNKTTGLFEEVFAVDKYDAPMPPSQLEKSITSYVFRTGEPLLLTAAGFEDLHKRGEVELVGAKPAAWLGTPLRTPSETIGVLAVQNYENPDCYSESDLQFLASVGPQVARAIERKQAEEALASSEAQLRALFASMRDTVFVIDRQGVYLEVAPTNPGVWYMDPQQLRGRRFQDVFTAEQTAVFSRAIQQVLDTKHTKQIEYELIFGDQSVWYEASISPMGADATLWVARDVTARKNVEEALARERTLMRALTDNIPDTIYFKDTDGRFILVNKAQARMLGLSDPAQALGKTDFDFFTEDNARMALEEERSILQAGKPLVTAEEELTSPGGRVSWVSTIKMPLPDQDGNVIGTFGISRDITERKQAEAQIQRQLDQMSALRVIDETIASSFDLRLSLETLLSRGVSLLGVDAAAIALVDAPLGRLEYAAQLGLGTAAQALPSRGLGASYAGRAVLERRALQIPNLTEGLDADMLPGFAQAGAFLSYYGRPLVEKGKVLGVLELFDRQIVERDQEWLDFLSALAARAAIAINDAQLFEGLQRSNTELSIAYDATIEGWSHALDLRDKETEGHTERVTELTVKLARTFDLSEADLVQVRWGSLLHDIGKMGVPDGILLKPGPLTDEEWVAMKKHPTLAYEMLSPIHYLRLALEIPYCHHEKWDGSGYPRGLKGDQIPLVARIFAVVDVWDALISDRPYRKAWAPKDALRHIREAAGTHFDPAVVKVFLEDIPGENE